MSVLCDRSIMARQRETLGITRNLKRRAGSVRRGEASGLERHFHVLRERLPEAIPLYLASAKAQLPLARAIGDAPAEAFQQIEAWLIRTAHDDEFVASNR